MMRFLINSIHNFRNINNMFQFNFDPIFVFSGYRVPCHVVYPVSVAMSLARGPVNIPLPFVPDVNR